MKRLSLLLSLALCLVAWSAPAVAQTTPTGPTAQMNGFGRSLDANEISPEDIYSPESYVDAAKDVVAEGFDALKFDLDVAARHV